MNCHDNREVDALSRLSSRKRLKVQIASAVVVGGALATAVGVASASGAPHTHAKNVVISALKSARFGTVLTDGTTLYTLKSNATSCTSTCHKYWIPVVLPKGDTTAVAGAGVSSAKLGTVKVKGGRQVTYGGKALYWFFEDKSAGQVKGNLTDTWGRWADVVLVRPTSKPATTTTTLKVTPTTTPAAPSPTTTVPTPTTTRPPTTTTTAPGGGGGVGF
jgi:predicted lipoprotein with Yx(FWY)xxD motif